MEQFAGFSDLFDTKVEFEAGTPEQSASEASNFSLTVMVHTGDRLRLRFFYLSNFLNRGQVEVLATRLVRLLHTALANPAQQLWQMDILASKERKQVLEEWNNHRASGGPVNVAFID